MDQLAGRTAIITGGADGIGRGSALALARRGVNIVVADINAEAGDAVAREAEAAGAAALSIPFDVAGDSFEDLKQTALDRFGRIDIVMNNVGVLTRGLPETLPVEEWQRIIDINLMSVIRSNHAFLPPLIAQGEGHIVNTASFAGLYSYAFDRLPYAACKAAIIQISEGLAIYLRPQGVNVTVLCPGPVKTNISASVRAFGPPTDVRGPGPQFALLDPADVGEQVVEAILANRFMLPTHPEVRDLLVERASDWDGFIQRQIDQPHIALAIPREG